VVHGFSVANGRSTNVGHRTYLQNAYIRSIIRSYVRTFDRRSQRYAAYRTHVRHATPPAAPPMGQSSSEPRAGRAKRAEPRFAAMIGAT
jgi:hypothetical protein